MFLTSAAITTIAATSGVALYTEAVAATAGLVTATTGMIHAIKTNTPVKKAKKHSLFQK